MCFTECFVIFCPSSVFLFYITELQQAKMEEEQQRSMQTAGEPSTADSRRPRIKKSAYFSDEEELSD